MPHSAPNIPESSPHHVKSETLNGILNAVKGACNNYYSGEIEANSTASGNSSQVQNFEKRKSFWAMITRRLRYFNKPSLSYLRISLSERIKKFSKPTTEYDIAGWYKSSNGLWITDQEKSPEPTAIQLWRNPWDSYDGYVREDGKWDEMNPYLFWPLQGQTNSFYYGPKEERYVKTGPQKATQGLLSPFAYEGAPSRVPEAEYYTGYCPQFFWCYSWCELIEDLDIKRRHSPIFSINSFKPPRQWETKWMSRHPAPILQDPNQPPYDPDNNPEVISRQSYLCIEWAVAEEYVSHGGDYGNAMSINRAHEVNNARTLCGTVVRMHKGNGNYYLFNNPQCPAGGGAGTQGIENAPYHFWAKTYSISSIW